MKKILAGLLATFLGLSLPAEAALLSPDPTGLWYAPDESGWGLSITQQADTILAVLFVYSAAGAPAWYVASAVQYHDDATGAPGGPNVAGPLYRTSGPWFGGPFDPNAVGVSSVGTLQMRYGERDGKTLSIAYDIDGVRVAKVVQRQSWRDARGALAGHYLGQFIVDGATPGCPQLGIVSTPTAPRFQVAVGGSGVVIGWGTGIDTACTIDGAYTQYGQLAGIAGTLSCGPIGSPFDSGMPVQLYGIRQDDWGMSAGMRLQNGACAYSAHLGGVRIP